MTTAQAYPPQLAEKIRRSREAAETMEERTIKCPCCGFRLLEVFGRDHHLTRVKCRKCKFEDIIDTAMFRTVRGFYSHRLYWHTDGRPRQIR